MQQQASRGMPDNDQTRAMVRDELINREVIAQEAQRSGFTKDPEVQAQVDMARQEALVGAYIRDWVRKHPVTDADVQKEYERVKAQAGDKEYKARHILVETEDQAKSLIAELKKGAQVRRARHQELQGPRHRAARRRPRLERARPVRPAVLRRDGEAREGQVHRDPGAHALRLPRHPARRRARREVPGARTRCASASSSRSRRTGSRSW